MTESSSTSRSPDWGGWFFIPKSEKRLFLDTNLYIFHKMGYSSV